jgi:hypothetical protein
VWNKKVSAVCEHSRKGQRIEKLRETACLEEKISTICLGDDYTHTPLRAVDTVSYERCS